MTSKKNSGTAVVTGASSGLGKIYAQRLAERGYNLLLVARRKDRLDSLATELQNAHNIKVSTEVADLSNNEHLERLSAKIKADESITLLVNNAGTAAMTPSSDITLEQVDDILEVNSRALIHLSLAALPGFRKRDHGTIVNIGSVLSFFAMPTSTTYSASKASVMLFSLGLQQELENTKVKVQLVMPAATATEIWEVAGVDVKAMDKETVMTAEDCVDAALSALDQGELITLPSVEDAKLWETFNAARQALFAGSTSGKAASRYKIPARV